MITCPNCGSLVREGQRFCGTCGTDVTAAATSAHPTESAEEERSSPYAYPSQGGYGQSSGGYGQSTGSYGESTGGYSTGSTRFGGLDSLGTQSPMGGRLMIIAGALILAICCAFACGLIFGFELIPDLLGIGGGSAVPPRPTTVPTPIGLLPIIHYVMAYL